MVATRRRREDDHAEPAPQLEPTGSGTDDDDAPEEVTLHTGKKVGKVHVHSVTAPRWHARADLPYVPTSLCRPP